MPSNIHSAQIREGRERKGESTSEIREPDSAVERVSAPYAAPHTLIRIIRSRWPPGDSFHEERSGWGGLCDQWNKLQLDEL